MKTTSPTLHMNSNYYETLKVDNTQFKNYKSRQRLFFVLQESGDDLWGAAREGRSAAPDWPPEEAQAPPLSWLHSAPEEEETARYDGKCEAGWKRAIKQDVQTRHFPFSTCRVELLFAPSDSERNCPNNSVLCCHGYFSLHLNKPVFAGQSLNSYY